MIPIKSERDVEKMRVACKSAASVLDKLGFLVRPGVTTGEIDDAAADFMSDENCRSAFLGYRNFPGNICISVNEEVVHGIGGSRRIQYGDIVKLDVGVFKGGWVGDTAKTVPVGAVKPTWSRLLTVTEDILDRVIPMVTAGRRLGDISAFIEDEVLANGYNVVREFVGHGVGRNLHEEPQIPNFGRGGTGPRLKAGMTLAIEPMVNLGGAAVRTLEDDWTVVTADQSPSAHFEHTVLVTKCEPQILTWREKVLAE